MKIKILQLLILSLSINTACNNNSKSKKEVSETKANASTFYHDIINARAGKDQHIIVNKIIEADKMEDFKGLQYYAPDSNYVVNTFIEFLSPEKKIFKTSTDREPIYYTFCKLNFKLNNTSHTLIAYSTEKENVTDLFIPFKDSTNTLTTYGGGRYLELKYRNEKTNFIVDFNYAFNPYCHYNHTYSCPFVPQENWLNTNILAGEKKLYEGEG